MMFGARIWSRAALYRLDSSVNLDPERLFPGEKAAVTLELNNRKFLPIIAQVELMAPQLLGNGTDGILVAETRLLSYERSRRVWAIPARRRGVASLGALRLLSGDLLGLYRRQKRLPGNEEIIVYPRRGELMPLHIPFQEYFGIHASKGPVEDPAWYAGTRDYTGNRPARNIHWKASARLGTLQEKLYEPTSHRKVLLALDTAGFSFPDEQEELEQLIETLATLATVLMETGASFGFVTNAPLTGSKKGILPVGRGPEHLGKLLELLARVENGEPETIVSLLSVLDRGDLGLVYCGARRDASIQDGLLRTNSRKMRKFFILAFPMEEPGEEFEGETWIGKDSDQVARPTYWNGFPVYRSRDVVHVP